MAAENVQIWIIKAYLRLYFSEAYLYSKKKVNTNVIKFSFT